MERRHEGRREQRVDKRVAGAGSPLLISGLPEASRRSYVLMLTKPGALPKIVPPQPLGIIAELDGSQLFDPVLTRPATQRTRVSSTTLSIGAPPPRKKTLLCTSRLSIPSKISMAGLV